MKCKFLAVLVFFVWFIGVIFFVGCSVNKRSISLPKESFAEKEYSEYLRQGDIYFSKMHLYGWRKAEEFYHKAYELKKLSHKN